MYSNCLFLYPVWWILIIYILSLCLPHSLLLAHFVLYPLTISLPICIPISSSPFLSQSSPLMSVIISHLPACLSVISHLLIIYLCVSIIYVFLYPSMSLAIVCLPVSL